VVAESLKEAYGNEQKLQDLADDLNVREYWKAANTIERFLPGLMSYTAFPTQLWKRLRTANMMEWVNRGLKRRAKVAGLFPNKELLLWLVGSILMDTNEEWVAGRRYLTLERKRSGKETRFRQITEDLRRYLRLLKRTIQ
jgi:Transposase and inactivated derivatives